MRHPHSSSLAEELSLPPRPYLTGRIAESIRYNLGRRFFPERFVGDECGEIGLTLVCSEATDELRRLKEKYPEVFAEIMDEFEQYSSEFQQ